MSDQQQPSPAVSLSKCCKTKVYWNGHEFRCFGCSRAIPAAEGLVQGHEVTVLVEDSQPLTAAPSDDTLTRVKKFTHWVETTQNDSLIGDSRVAFDSGVRTLRQLAWFLEGPDEYLNTAVEWSWTNKTK